MPKSEENQKEFKNVLGHRLVSLVLYAVSPRHNAADTLDRINREVDVITSTAESFLKA